MSFSQVIDSNIFRFPLYSSNSTQQFRLHLITSDLWEAITGERISPAKICQFSDCSMPLADETPNNTALQANQIISMAKDRQKSRILQLRLNDCSNEDKKIIFNAFFSHMNELVADPTANFVVQKFCEVANEAQKKEILNFFLSDPKYFVDHQIACRVLQKFIETTSVSNIDKIYLAMKKDLISYCLSPNGNHIVQRFVSALSDRIYEIVEIIRPHVTMLAVDSYGCRVVQKLFELHTVDKLQPLVDEVMKSCVELSMDQYGNYVVQYILADKTQANVSKMINDLSGNFYKFSVHKFASNVIEKCIRGATSAQREKMFDEILGGKDSYEAKRILQMVVDQFGNYVIQRIVEFGTSEQQNIVYDVVYDNYDRLIHESYAKHVITKLQYLGFEF